ncbi:MAG: phosphotransferase family protein [Steroidobacteraceae bacterium]
MTERSDPAAHGAPQTALLLPPTDRMLRGVRTALGEMDLNGRADLQHVVRMVDMVVAHVLLRQDVSLHHGLYRDMAALAKEASVALLSKAGLDHSRLQAALDALSPELPQDLAFDATQVRIGAAMACLRDLTPIAIAAGDHKYTAAINALEERFYAANLRSPEMPENKHTVVQLTHELFERWLLQRAPGKYQCVAKFQRLVGGFQKETILVDAKLATGELEGMVIRAEKHDRFVRMTASEITEEYEIVRLMWERGIPIAEPLWLESDAKRWGRRFMVSRRATGRNTGDAMGSSSQFPPELTRSFIDTLARIHNTPLDERAAKTKLGTWLPYRRLPENTLQEIRVWRHQIWMDRAPASPAFVRIFDWLEGNVPTDEGRICVLHNDYGPHNILVDGNQVQAVLDWEVPRVGDPAEDVSFFLQCCTGAIDREAAIKLYRELSGNDVSEYRLKYFDVLSCAKVLMSALSASTMYQATEPALLDWCQMPLQWMLMFQRQVEDKIRAAEAARVGT